MIYLAYELLARLNNLALTDGLSDSEGHSWIGTTQDWSKVDREEKLYELSK